MLLTTLGGTTYAWDSLFIVGLGAIAALALAGFVLVEHRVPEPVLPLELFRNRVFVTTSAMGFVVGFALFGALTYLPLFQQVVPRTQSHGLRTSARAAHGRTPGELDRLAAS